MSERENSQVTKKYSRRDGTPTVLTASQNPATLEHISHTQYGLWGEPLHFEVSRTAPQISLSDVLDTLPSILESQRDTVLTIPEDHSLEWKDLNWLRNKYTGDRAHWLYFVTAMIAIVRRPAAGGAPFHPSLYKSTGLPIDKEVIANVLKQLFAAPKATKRDPAKLALLLENTLSTYYTFNVDADGKTAKELVAQAAHDPLRIREQAFFLDTQLKKRLQALAPVMAAAWDSANIPDYNALALEERTMLRVQTDGGAGNYSVQTDGVYRVNNIIKVLEVKTGASGYEAAYVKSDNKTYIDVNKLNPYQVVSLLLQMMNGWVVNDRLLKDWRKRLEVYEDKNPNLYTKIDLRTEFETWIERLLGVEIEIQHYDVVTQKVQQVYCRMSADDLHVALANLEHLTRMTNEPTIRAMIEHSGQFAQQISPRLTNSVDTTLGQVLLTGFLAGR